MGLSLPKSNLIFLKKCLDKWVHFKPTYLLTGEILTDKVYDEIFDGCPREKEQALEEVLRSISRLY